uniref:Myb-like domain-containing protein n=1 Tax=Picea sitchensis TaxID=3332 RepID=D5A8W4_PICSI|nr:unknown [Picea sitchensis]
MMTGMAMTTSRGGGGASLVDGGSGEGEAAAETEDIEKLEENRDHGGKKKRAELWQDAEMDALVSAYRQIHLKLMSSGNKGRHIFKSANDKWTEVRNLLLTVGVDRQPKEIERKWSNLLTAFKQIADWNRQAGQPSYWELDEALKREKTKAKELPASFRIQMFESMAEFLGDTGGKKSRQSNQSNAPPTFYPSTSDNSDCCGTAAANSGSMDVPLPLEKISCQLNRKCATDPLEQKRTQVVLLLPGSFNPPTYMHLRMFDTWWENYGATTPILQKMAIRVLSQTCSSSGCERNWSVFEKIHTKKRNRLDTSCLNDLVYVHYNLRLWVKQLEIKIDARAISLDEIDTTAAWRVEVEEPVAENALDWLEDSGDDHGIFEDLDHDVSEDIQFHAKSASVPPAERESQSEGDRPSGSTSSRPPLPVPSSRGHLSQGSSTSSRGRLTPVRGAHASRAPTPAARGKAVSTAITFARKKSRGNPIP